MVYQLIGAALIIGLLVCFSVLAILWLSKIVTTSIKKKTVDLFSTYDYILEEKSRNANDLIAEIKAENFDKTNKDNNQIIAESQKNKEENKVTKNYASFPSQMFNSTYRDKNIGNLYSKIRSGFTTRPCEVLSRIQLDKSVRSQIAEQILNGVSFDNFYRLTCLEEKEQIELLKDVFTSDQFNLLNEYIDSTSKFSSIKFYEFLNDIHERNSNSLILRVSPSCDVSNIPQDVKLIVDPLILEGFEIEAGNKIYDFGLRAREIC